MSFTFDETPDSRTETLAPPTYTTRWKAVGEVDDAVVINQAAVATPAMVFRPSGTLYRQDIRSEPDGHAQYQITVPYARLSQNFGSLPAGSSTFRFSTQGATINIKASKQKIKSYPVDGAFHKGAINVSEDGSVKGADIVIPALKLTYAFKHPQGVVTESFARLLASVTGRTNTDIFRGFQPGELLFLGASGGDGTDAEAAVAYEFAVSSNETNLTIGQITSIVKDGHHLAWIEFEDDVDGGEAIRPAKRVHVERVYDSFGFASVFGWS